MISISNILQHFSKEEEKFVRKTYNSLEEVKFNFIQKDLGFLNPRELEIVKQLANSFDVKVVCDGFYNQAELKYVVLYHEEMGYIPQTSITAYELKYNTKFNKLTHKQVLGTLFNSGIDMRLVGDIIVDEQARIQIIMATELENILLLIVLKYANVKVEYIKLDQISLVPISMKRKIYSTKSLRLDAICKMLSKIARTKMSKKIAKGDIAVNFKVCTNVTQEILEGDLVSIRGIGRFKILEIRKVNQKYNIAYDEQV